MRKFWTVVARFLAVIFAVLFVLTAGLSLWLVRIERRLFLPETYKAALASQQVYARLPRILAEQLVTAADFDPCAENPLLCEDLTPEFKDCVLAALGQENFDQLSQAGAVPAQEALTVLRACQEQFGTVTSGDGQGSESGMPPFLAALGVSDWETLLSTLLPPEQLRQTVEQVLDQLFAYLNGQTDTVSVPLAAIKNRLGGPAGVEAFQQILAAQPECSSGQLQQMLASLAPDSNEMVLCRPPQADRAQVTPLIQNQLALVVSQIPDQAVLLDPESGENSSTGGPRAGLGAARLALRLSPDIPLLFLLLVSLFSVRSGKSWLRWWGIPFFLAGLGSLLVAWGFQSAFERIWITLLASRIPAYLTLGLVTVVHDLAKTILLSVLRSVGVVSALLGGLGAGMWIASFFLRKGAGGQQPPEPAELPPAA